MKTTIFITKILRQIMRLKKIWGNVFSTSKNIYVNDRVGFYKQMWESAAAALGAEIKSLSDDLWEVSKDSKKVCLNNYKVPLDDPVTLSIAGDKDLCFRLLSPINIPIPDYTVFEIPTLKKGMAFFMEKEGPFAVKPSSGTSGGRGVSLWITSYSDFISAVALASLYGNRIIIEKMIIGESYRLLFLGNQLLHVARRTGFRVKGDGTSTLSQLIENATKKAVGKRATPKSDDDLKLTLGSQNISAGAVPKKGQHILVKSLPVNINGGVETIAQYNENVTGKISQSIIDTAQKASAHLGIYFAGVDLITTDPTIPLEQSGGAIIEVNSTPGLHHHYDLKGQSDYDQPAIAVLKHLLLENNSIGEYR